VERSRYTRLTTASLLAVGLTALVAIAITYRVPYGARREVRHFDLLITGGRILDGTGNPWFRADIGVRGDRIVAMGNLSASRADRVIYADGLLYLLGEQGADRHFRIAGFDDLRKIRTARDEEVGQLDKPRPGFDLLPPGGRAQDPVAERGHLHADGSVT